MDNLRKLKVLLVEDEAEIRSTISVFLKRRVGTVFLAQNGKEGLELFKRNNPDLIISDIRMPVMNGLEMIRLIREINDEVPVIVTTGHSDEKFLLESINIGVERYLKKPIAYSDLVSALRHLARIVLQKRELDRKNQILQAVLDHSSQFFLILENLKIVYMNRPFLDYLGFRSLEEFLDSKVRLEDFLIRDENVFVGHKNFVRIFSEMIRNPEMDYTVYMKSREGWQDDESAFLISLRPILEGEQYLVSFTDVTMMEMIQNLYRDLATRDSLTGILNRKTFFKELRNEIERVKRYGSSFSLIMMDIDYFKKVNDQYGHQAGDKVLLSLVELIKKRIRRSDKFGRYGGEEFVLLLPATALENAVELAECLRNRVEEHDFEMGIPRVTVSFGVVGYRTGESMEQLVKRADEALYLAKKEGRNCVKYNV